MVMPAESTRRLSAAPAPAPDDQLGPGAQLTRPDARLTFSW